MTRFAALNWLDIVSLVELGATLFLITTLSFNKLYSVYRFLFAYLVADAMESVAGLSLQANRTYYARIYFAGQTVKIILAIFVVLEMYRIALAGHPAIARFGRKTVMYVLAIAAVIALAAYWVDRNAIPERSRVIHYFTSFERTMDAWMLLFLLIISVFMLWFPVRLKRNSVLYIGGFLVYFLVRWLGLLLSNIAPALLARYDGAMILTQIACLILWIFALQPAGERATTVLGHRWDPAAAHRLKLQLDAINTALLRFSRREL